MAAGWMLIAMALQGVTLESRIVRAGPAGEDVAAYVAIANPGAEDRLVEASCACAERVEVHRMVAEPDGDGRAMEVARSLAIPGRVEIRPRSDLHLMLRGLRAPLAQGQSVPVTLRFERAGAVTGQFLAVEDTGAAWAAAAPAAAATLAPELQPLAFLVGSCWRGTFPNSAADRHPLLHGDARRPLRSRPPCRRGRAGALFGRDASTAGTRRRGASATIITPRTAAIAAAPPSRRDRARFPRGNLCRRRRPATDASQPPGPRRARAISPQARCGRARRGAKCGRCASTRVGPATAPR